MFTALIVDDEKPQQQLLSGMLARHFPQIQLVGICNGVNEGVEKINLLRPQLVFLDVMMPPQTGFDLLNRVEQLNFEVIFITSYQKFAIQAFRASAVDYLLKPFSLEDLKTAIEKFEKLSIQKNSIGHIQTLLHNVNSTIASKKKVALPTHSGFMFAETGNISHGISVNVYTTFYFADNTSIIICKSIGDCEQMLAEFNFLRIHNRNLINLSFLKEYIRGDGGQVKMNDGTILDVSRSGKEELMKAINKKC